MYGMPSVHLSVAFSSVRTGGKDTYKVNDLWFEMIYELDFILHMQVIYVYSSLIFIGGIQEKKVPQYITLQSTLIRLAQLSR